MCLIGQNRVKFRVKSRSQEISKHMASRTEWYKTLRQTIKLEVGVGWSVRGRGEKEVQKTQVQYTYQDGLGKKNPRDYVVLPYDWSSRNQSQIITAVAELKHLMTERNCSLTEEAKVIQTLLIKKHGVNLYLL